MEAKAIVIIPTYNERDNISLLVPHILSLAPAFDVLVVDDNSPDGTSAAVEALQGLHGSRRLLLLKRPQKQGIGPAYIAGFKHVFAHDVPYAYILQMDADFSHHPDDLPRLLACCQQAHGADMAIGSRYTQGVNVINWPMTRVLLSYFASFYVRLVTGLPVADATAGFACYRREVLEAADLSRLVFSGYAFQIGIKHLLWKHGASLEEISVVFTDRIRGQSKMSLSIFQEAAFGVLRLAIQGLTQKYKPLKRISHAMIPDQPEMLN